MNTLQEHLPVPTVFSIDLRSLLTASLIGASLGLGGDFISIQLTFLGRTTNAVSDLLIMQMIGFSIVTVPWIAYRWHRGRRVSFRAAPGPRCQNGSRLRSSSLWGRLSVDDSL